MDPYNSNAYRDLGVGYPKVGDTEMAEIAFCKGVRLRPEDSLIYSKLAGHLIREGKLQESIETFERCIELNPYDVQTLEIYSKALEEAGRHIESAEALRKARRLRDEER